MLCYGQEEMQRYQFSGPGSAPDKPEPDFSHQDTASTSLIDAGQLGAKSNVATNGHQANGAHNGGGQGNGFFNGGLSGALNTDRARLFKKANSCGRPVREWYV